MLDARSIGFSVHEITVSYHASQPRLTQAPLWWFESTRGRLRYVPVDYGLFGQALLPGRWLIHGGAGIGIACAIAAVFKRLSLEDWLIWSERFGQPGIHGVTSAVPDSPEWEQACDALRAYSADWQVLTGEGVRFEPIGAIPYPKLVERMDRAIAALWRGADLSTLSAGTGEGSGASLQGDEADLIEQDACAEISETLHATLDRLIADLLFGPAAPLLATFSLTPATRPDVAREIAIDTQRQMADSVARIKAIDDVELELFPAWALVRTGTRRAPREDWPARWKAAGDAVNWKGASRTRFAALKTSPIWAALGDGAGGFKDALGNPFPPFAYSSGMNWRDLDEDEARRAKVPMEDLDTAALDVSLAPGRAELREAMRKTGLRPEDFLPPGEARHGSPVANSRTPIRGGNPDNPGQFSKAPGSGQRERETHAAKDSLGRTFDPEHPERLTATDNIARGKKAIARALSRKEDVRDAMYRPECGPIDFIWGTPGTKGEDWAGGGGISHAFAKHPGDIKKLPEMIARGTAYKVKTTKNDVYDYHGRIAFIYGDGAVFVDPQPKGKSLLVTGYRKRDEGGFPSIEKGPKA